MATVKFTEDSPYKSSHIADFHTDFKYTRFLKEYEISAESSEEIPENLQKLNVALFGLGRAGIIHIGNILTNPKIKLLYVVEKDPKRIRHYEQWLNLDDTLFITCEEEERVFQDSRVHGVIIASSTLSHARLVAKALNAKKAVLCEKPVSFSYEETKKCYALAEQMETPLFCAFNRRFDPSFREVFDQVRSGKVGRVHIIKTVVRDSPLNPLEFVKTSGGMFHDCTIHDIDLVCWIVGEYPVEVVAVASTFIPEIKEINDYDTVAVTMKFESGTIGLIDQSRNGVYGYDQRLEVFGPKGMVEATNERPVQVSYSNTTCQTLSPIYYSFPSRYQESYRQELIAFCDLIQGKKVEDISVENTLKISKIAEACHESVEKGQVVKVQY